MTRAQKIINKLLKVIKDKDDLLTCYRLGKKPKEGTLDRISKNILTVAKAKQYVLIRLEAMDVSDD